MLQEVLFPHKQVSQGIAIAAVRQDIRRRYATSQEVAELADLIYEGLLEAVPWQTFVQRLREITATTRVSIQINRAASADREIRVAATLPHNKTDWAALRDEYRRKYMTTDPLCYYRLPSGHIVTMEELKNAAHFEDMLVPMGLQHFVRLSFAEPGGMNCWLEINGLEPDGPFDAARDIQLVQDLHPHLQRALRLYARMLLVESEKSVYEEAVNHLTIGCILLDGSAKVLESNQIARQLMSGEPNVVITDGRLVIRDEAANENLQRAVAAAIQKRSQQNPGSHVDLVRLHQGDRASLSFLILATPLLRYYQGDYAPHVIVYLSDPEQRISDSDTQRRSAEKLVAKLLNVTQSEAKLAILLADGLDLTAASKAMGITEGSARTYSKRLYEKTNIKRQGDLIRLIYKSVALLG